MLSPFSGVPGAARLMAWSILARMPLAAIGVVLVVHAREITGSYAAAGAVAGANAVATATGSPLLGRIVDRRGQTATLLASAALCGVALLGAALLPGGSPVVALAALAALAGLAQPPLGACVRAIWPRLIPAERLQAAYSLEAAVLELTYIIGPPLALAAATLWSTAAGVTAIAAVLLVGTAGFAALPASRGWRPAETAPGRRPAALRAPGLRTLVLAMALVGLLLGAVEVAVPAIARAHGAQGATGPLLALWGLGSMLGGLLAARAGGLHGTGALAGLLAGLAGGHLVLITGGGLPVLGALLLVAGLPLAPAFAALYALVDRVAEPGTVTEAFAWLTTALGIGIAGGAAAGGALADLSPAATFAFAAAAGGVATAAVLARSATLAPAVPSSPCASGLTAGSPSPSATAPATP